MSDAALRQVIVEGKAPMPAFGPVLAPEQIDHIVLFVRTLAKPNPEPPSEAAPR